MESSRRTTDAAALWVALNLVLVLGISFAVKADPIDSTFTACSDKNQTTMGRISCLTEALSAWDAELNKVYKSLAALLPKDEKDKLRASQTKWIVFRDADVEFLNGSYSRLEGTIYKTYLMENKLNLTKARVAQLRRYAAEIEEGKGDI